MNQKISAHLQKDSMLWHEKSFQYSSKLCTWIQNFLINSLASVLIESLSVHMSLVPSQMIDNYTERLLFVIGHFLHWVSVKTTVIEVEILSDNFLRHNNKIT